LVQLELGLWDCIVQTALAARRARGWPGKKPLIVRSSPLAVT
jgi:hypothetical protein